MRKYYSGRGQGPLRPLFATSPQPSDTPIGEARLLALDLELTDLDPKKAEVISVGFVPVEGLRIRLCEARRILVRPEGTVARSAHVHMLRDEDLVGAAPVVDALVEVVEALVGRTLLVHYASLDHAVLSRLCKKNWSAPLLVPVIDTLFLAHRSAVRSGQEPRYGSLRLPALRAKYGLPVVKLHGALSDAIATAELFLAMVAERGLQSRLGDFRKN